MVQKDSELPEVIRVVGMLGHPVRENPIDQIYNAVFESNRAPFRFVKFEVPEPASVAEAIAGARALGFCRLGITVPHKEVAYAHLERLGQVEPNSRGIGAVNLVEFTGKDRTPLGLSNDGDAILDATERMLPTVGARVLILGAGGAARGIGARLADRGAAKVSVAARRPAQGKGVCEMIAARFDGEVELLDWERPIRVPPGTDMVLNATTVGAAPECGELNLDFDSLTTARLAVDIVSRPRVTPLLAEAARRGVPTVDGMDMLFFFARTFAEAEGYDVADEFFENLSIE